MYKKLLIISMFLLVLPIVFSSDDQLQINNLGDEQLCASSFGDDQLSVCPTSIQEEVIPEEEEGGKSSSSFCGDRRCEFNENWENCAMDCGCPKSMLYNNSTYKCHKVAIITNIINKVSNLKHYIIYIIILFIIIILMGIWFLFLLIKRRKKKEKPKDNLYPEE